MNPILARRAGGRVAPLAATALLLLATAASAHDPGQFDGRHGRHPTGHVKRLDGQTWPPQPQGASEIVDKSDRQYNERERAHRDQRFQQLESRFGQDAAMREMRGRRLTRLGIVEIDDKERGSVSERRYQYFDRAANVTRTVIEPVGGPARVESTPASVYQPEITPDEVRDAVALARSHFARQGQARVAGLLGYGIQAYKPTGSGFYNGRVVYVSFHAASDADPEYVAWVDLSHDKVLAARKESAQ